MKTQGFSDIKPAARTLSLVEVTIPMGCQKNREPRSPSGSADLGYGTHIRNACLYDCLVEFLIGRRVYLEVIIGVSIALGLL